MKILCACEESQAVTTCLRSLGHEAYSCDIQATSGLYPDWHIQDDVLKYIQLPWDIIIAFPPCTYLTLAGNRFLNVPGRSEKRDSAAAFFLSIYNAPCEHIAIENPVGYMNTYFRKPDQIINPFDFGDSYCKRTCLWLKNLPCLIPDYQIPNPRIDWVSNVPHTKDRAKNRSKTFPGVARAMAYQFTNNFYVL